MHPALADTSHRPWPLPAGPWIMAQTWHDLLFAHWPVETGALRSLVPGALPLDTFEGQAWVGVAPFHMSHIHARGLPPFPGVSRFPELNVRTYGTLGGKPGVYFFSLDAARRLAVWAARTFYRLPYFFAEMSSHDDSDWIRYSSRRLEQPAEFRGRYRPVRPVELRARGSLEHWLTERYCLYTTHAGAVYRAEIHHQPWPLQDAECALEINSVAKAAGVTLSGDPLVHFARRLEVLVWPLRRIAE